ncbi:hypothetical protein RHMOL_Rhmol04G0236500 [Rhododendron molle]|uniref:Uncharacterized protein n=2 Tax=Rhododendron molle TaxID=49168 RepID=A0ACC0P576_RHOML|nr:hypothetical protein RHMOL_Rhmol04G0236500 [Rhododendron molle]KAI8560184.1 hypothetical protein RHMOL_Rhmol04G0236500 [Rhododendron molle]
MCMGLASGRQQFFETPYRKSTMLGQEGYGLSSSATEVKSNSSGEFICILFPFLLHKGEGFEAEGPNTPSNIDPWSIIGNESSLVVSTDHSSCFDRNKVALQMDVLCDRDGANVCPDGGVGVYNPGFWDMNVEQGKKYKVVLYIRSLQSVNISISLTGSNGLQMLATANIIFPWKLIQWLSIRKLHAYFMSATMGHGLREDLSTMLADLKPGFIRFPVCPCIIFYGDLVRKFDPVDITLGGCFVEGEWLRNAFWWKETIGPWAERPRHFGDVWMYWTDEGLGYFEFLQLAEDLGAAPVWVFNNGISHNDQVDTSSIVPFLQEILDSLEFAKGAPDSAWGSVRAAMGHPEPFDLRYVAVGNEDCGKKNYRGSYCTYSIEITSGFMMLLDMPIQTSNLSPAVMALLNNWITLPISNYHAFVSEYAVTGKDASTGSLLAALAEAGFLIGLA